MNKFFIFCLLWTNAACAFLDFSPWLMFENKTPTSFLCSVQVSCDSTQPLTLQSDDQNPKIMVNIMEQEQNCFMVHFKFELPAQTTVTFQPMFFSDTNALLPTIKNISIQCPLLQATYFFDTHNIDHRYFTVGLTQNSMLSLTSHAIPLTSRIKTKFKQTLLACIHSMKENIESL